LGFAELPGPSYKRGIYDFLTDWRDQMCGAIKTASEIIRGHIEAKVYQNQYLKCWEAKINELEKKHPGC
jgi:hypothetical protein